MSVCVVCGEREASRLSIEEGGWLAPSEGWPSIERDADWCELCVLKEQLANIRDFLADVPSMQRREQECLRDIGRMERGG